MENNIKKSIETEAVSMAERRKKGLLWIDTGENVNQQVYARGLCQDFNQTKATEVEKRREIWKKLFASCGEDVWIEPLLSLAVSDFMSCRWSAFITGQQIASFFVIDSFRCSGDFPPRIMTKYNWIVLLEFLQ